MYFSRKKRISRTSLLFSLLFVLAINVSVARGADNDASVVLSQENFSKEAPTTLTFSFSALNQKSYQLSAFYVIVFKAEDSDLPTFTQVIRQPISLSPKVPLSITGTIPMPTFLVGKYNAFIEIQSPSGSVLADGTTKNPITFGSSNPIKIKGCLSGSTNLTPVTPLEIDEDGNVPEIVCIFTSVTDNPERQNYTFTGMLNEYSLTGKEMGRWSQSFSIGKGEEQVVRIPEIAKGLKPGMYTFLFEVRNEKIELMAAPLVAPAQVKGLGANLISTKPNGDAYTKGETAIFSLDLRPTPAVPQADSLFVQAEMKDAQGVCGKSQSFPWMSSQDNILIPLDKNCASFQLTTTVKDKNGNELDTLTENFGYYDQSQVTGMPQASENKMASKMQIAILILAGLGIIGLSWYLIRRHRRESSRF